ncbi:hypothetical protein CEXT_31741 [Caerostris extrusa]|uniref:Uncharacterized protein n=1 Tax=Caerostris extrusa TaxID=172846 RepID=A0AAV4MM40_CAEEX|nr:hypothetical protein CEXT_31741 [Caerostris extrusa]
MLPCKIRKTSIHTAKLLMRSKHVSKNFLVRLTEETGSRVFLINLDGRQWLCSVYQQDMIAYRLTGYDRSILTVLAFLQCLRAHCVTQM